MVEEYQTFHFHEHILLSQADLILGICVKGSLKSLCGPWNWCNKPKNPEHYHVVLEVFEDQPYCLTRLSILNDSELAPVSAFSF